VSASGSAITTPASLGATASGLTTPSTAPTPGVATITIVLKNGKVSPNGDRVMLDRGQPFVLDITSDRDDEVHVHGFDEQVEVKAGDHVKLELIAGVALSDASSPVTGLPIWTRCVGSARQSNVISSARAAVAARERMTVAIAAIGFMGSCFMD